MFSHTEWLADISFDFAGATFPIEGFGTIGAFITSLTMPEMQVRTVEQPEGFMSHELSHQFSVT